MDISFEEKTPPPKVEIDKVTLKPVEVAQPAELYLRIEVDAGHIIHRPATPKDLETYARQFAEFHEAQSPERLRAVAEAKVAEATAALDAAVEELAALPPAPEPAEPPKP